MRSDFLVHWTGKDICKYPNELDTGKRNNYVDRLVDILTYGFWMTVPTPVERVEGFADSWIEYKTPMTCFTEIRLSQAQEHSSRYGLLGVSVDRRFVLDRYGGPVHYVRNHSQECIVGNMQDILGHLQSDPLMVNYFGVAASFLKAMSRPNTDDFQFLNEHEWRIVHTLPQQNQQRIIATNVPRPEYRVPVSRTEVRVVVFPDDLTRTAACSDQRIVSWLSQAPGRPIFLTLAECQHF